MPSKVIQSYSISEWYDLVTEAQGKTGYQCDENVQHYLILTLDKFITDDSISSSIFAIDFFKGINKINHRGVEKLRSTGDRCLILSGLFPDNAKKRNVSLSYFINIGRRSYQIIAHHRHIKYDPELFNKLSYEFIHLTDLLHAMRHLFNRTLQ